MVFHWMTKTKLIFFFTPLSNDEVKYHLILKLPVTHSPSYRKCGFEHWRTKGEQKAASLFSNLITTDAIYDEEKHKFFEACWRPEFLNNPRWHTSSHRPEGWTNIFVHNSSGKPPHSATTLASRGFLGIYTPFEMMRRDRWKAGGREEEKRREKIVK